MPMTTDTFAISLEEKRDVVLSNIWSSSKSKYPLRAGNHIEPLINGYKAFKAVHEAIEAATKTIDIISWGFDPSMRFNRPDGKRIGDLLREKAKAGIEVRILIWKNALANFAENNIIGDGFGGSGGGSAGTGSGVGNTSAGGSGQDADTHNNYGNKAFNSAAVQRNDDEARNYNREWFDNKINRLWFKTRDFSILDKSEIELDYIDKHGNKNPSQRIVMSLFPSHHQKMVLVDYENTEKAVGFVMGHNMLRNYWDTDEHLYESKLREGFAPWQDLSTKVYGPVLWDMNENFCTAWEKARSWVQTALKVPESRLSIKPEAYEARALKAAVQSVVPAQICRTQPQESDQSIRDVYQVALNNARQYLYFENQYFRYKEFATLLRENRRKLKSAGWKKDFYVFVVTNAPDGSGKLNTYEILAALGKASVMPTIHKEQTENKKIADDKLYASDLQGINIVVCTLKSSNNAVNSADRKYCDIYVHSKLLLVDDIFFTVGSANVNARSMESDSEINIAAAAPIVTANWRNSLWKLHAKSVNGDLAVDFESWRKSANDNLVGHRKKMAIKNSLIEFSDDSKSSLALD